jgi:hypothetical protein
MDFKKGDFIIDTLKRVGEVVDIDEDNNLEVYFIESFQNEANGKIFKYSEEWEVVRRDEVVEHTKKPSNKFDYLKLYTKLGYKPMGFYKGHEIFIDSKIDIEKDKDLKNFKFPTDGFDSDDEEDDTDSLDGFIVPDEEGEPFTPASPTNDYVKFTHQAVNDYNTWVPDETDKFQVGLKRKIDSMEAKYSQKEDDRQFASGKSIDYNHPPLKVVKSTSK